MLTGCRGEVEWDPSRNGTAAGRTVLPLQPRNGGAQDPEILRLAHRGEEMKRPVRFLARHLWGLITVNAFVLSGLIALGALTAYVFRMMYLEHPMRFLAQLGFRDDMALAFVPAFVAFLIWLLCVSISSSLQKRRYRIPAVSSFAYVMLILTSCLGGVVVLSTANVDLSILETGFDVPKAMSDSIRTVLTWLTNGLLLVFTVSIVPYLNVKRLIQSGTQKKNRLQSWIFNLASYTLLIGAPFVVFYVLSREDVSGWNSKRPQPNAMSRAHIRKWPEFWRSLDEPIGRRSGNQNKTTALAEPDATPGEVIWLWLDNAELPAAGSGNEVAASVPNRVNHPIQQSIALQERIDDQDRDLWFPERWLQFVGWLARLDDRFDARWSDAERAAAWKDAVIGELNHECLADPSFFECFQTSKAERRFPLLSGPAAAGAALPTFDPERELSTAFFRGLNGQQRLELVRQLGQRCEQIRDDLVRGYEAESPPTLRTAWRRLRTALAGLLGVEIADRPGYVSVPQAGATERRWHYQDTEGLWQWLTGRYREAAKAEKHLMETRHLLADEDQVAHGVKLAQATAERRYFEEHVNRVQCLNWNLMRAYFGPEAIYPQSEVFAIVVTGHDQAFRRNVFWWALAAFVVVGLLSVNPTLVHGYYRDQLAALWVNPHPSYGVNIPMHALTNCERGGPLHLVSASVSYFGRRRPSDMPAFQRFSFSKTHVGGKRVGYCATENYIRGGFTLPEAMAISGAAVTPTSMDSVIVRTLLVLFNIRMGKWLPHPSDPPGDLAYPAPLRLLWDVLAVEPARHDFLFVCDGGHDENTGIGALLQRRCRIIIACDSSQDPAYEFVDFRRLLRSAREKHGVRLAPTDGTGEPFTLDDLVPDRKTQLAMRHFVVLRIDYPESENDPKAVRTGYLILVKPNLTREEPIDLKHFRIDSPDFPHDSTLDQFFEVERFLAYRHLGERMGDNVCALLLKGLAESSRDTTWLAQWRPDAGAGSDQPVPPDDPGGGGGNVSRGVSVPLVPIVPSSAHSATLDTELDGTLARLRSPDPDSREYSCVELTNTEWNRVPADHRDRAAEALRSAILKEQESGLKEKMQESLLWVLKDHPMVADIVRAMGLAWPDHLRKEFPWLDGPSKTIKTMSTGTGESFPAENSPTPAEPSHGGKKHRKDKKPKKR